MSRYHSYLNSAKQILQTYRGDEPFASYLKKYFSANKKFGSKDRKQVSNLCYCFFRLGKAVMNVSLEEKILTALFLCSDQSSEILEALKPEWNEKINLAIEEKLLILNYSFLIKELFPWEDLLSHRIDFERFGESFLVQPDLFIRLRPGKEESVKQKLQRSGFQFKILSENCLSLANASKIDDLIELDKEAVIQDYNSQKTGEILKSYLQYRQNEISVWDCCAGSGGKSIMAYDINSKIDLTVSDSRESILANLKKRFETAGIKNFKAKISDLNSQIPNQVPIVNESKFQLILCDVPCSGSGTWSRTPEQLYFFHERKIDEYAALQKRIVSNVIPYLKPGGSFVYITCSVFKKENEEVAEFIEKKFHLEPVSMEVLKGYNKKADSMFIAEFNS